MPAINKTKLNSTTALSKDLNIKSSKKLQQFLVLLNQSKLIFTLGKKLLALFPNLEELFHSQSDLTKLGLTQKEVANLKSPNWQLVTEALLWAEKPNHHIIMFGDDLYPPQLKEIADPPVLLFARGDLNLLKLPQIAIIGSRAPTPIGSEIAFNFAEALTTVNIVITSGLAFGIDAAAHCGAINKLGKTIAVLGTGLNLIYPKAHLQLAEQIVSSGGLLLSEFPLNAPGKS